MAGCEAIAARWARDQGLDPKQWHYVADGRDLYGLENGAEIMLLCEWWLNGAAETFTNFASYGRLKGVYP